MYDPLLSLPGVKHVEKSWYGWYCCVTHIRYPDVLWAITVTTCAGYVNVDKRSTKHTRAYPMRVGMHDPIGEQHTQAIPRH